MKRTHWVLLWIALMVVCALDGLEFWLKFVAIGGYIVAYVIVNTAKIAGMVS